VWWVVESQHAQNNLSRGCADAGLVLGLLHCLPVGQWFIYKAALTTFKVQAIGTPAYLSSVVQSTCWQGHCGHLMLQRWPSLHWRQHCLACIDVAAPTVWNSLLVIFNYVIALAYHTYMQTTLKYTPVHSQLVCWYSHLCLYIIIPYCVVQVLLLWSPYVIGQTIIFSCCGLFFFFLSFLFFFFSSPNLSGRRLDVYHTLAHGVALVRI